MIVLTSLFTKVSKIATFFEEFFLVVFVAELGAFMIPSNTYGARGRPLPVAVEE